MENLTRRDGAEEDGVKVTRTVPITFFFFPLPLFFFLYLSPGFAMVVVQHVMFRTLLNLFCCTPEYLVFFFPECLLFFFFLLHGRYIIPRARGVRVVGGCVWCDLHFLLPFSLLPISKHDIVPV